MKNDTACRSLSERICRSLRIPFRGTRILEGSTILYRTGHGLILKIFSSEEPWFCRNEAEFLKLLSGKLSVKTPELFATGIFEGFPYLLMEEISDVSLKENWREKSMRDKIHLIEQIACMLRELHSIPVSRVNYRETVWETFIARQLKHLRRNHHSFGVDNRVICQIEEYIQRTEPVENTSRQVICHTEIMPEHLFSRVIEGNSVLTGLIDFEPSMIAIPEYDLCAAGVFISAGEKGLFKRLLDAYSYTGSRESIMRMLLLHRYSNMKWFISELPEEIQSGTMDDLCNYWFS